MKVYAFVPAKGTSERVENKNMRFLDGERLFIRALKTLLKCKEIDQVFLDTEMEEMYNLVDYLPVKFMKRDPALANNKTDGHKMLLNEVESFPDADIYVQMLCTSPFINPKTIDQAIRKLKEDPSFDSAVLMKRDKYYFWEGEQPKYDINHIPNSKDLPDTLTEAMGLYVIRKPTALSLQKRYGKSPLLIWGTPAELIDVNTPEDLAFAEVYAKGLKNTENRELQLMKHFVSSPALSDLLDDMKQEMSEDCGAVLSSFSSNISGVKLLGRANTLKLRTLKEDEDFKGIYDALESYKGISDNNIIIVENEESDFAYFGDLNARLAISSGASGAIIGGTTRDKLQTQLLNFPVYSKGYNAKDVRYRATVDYINKPIFLNDIQISPGDLVFADESAIVIIYNKYENEVIKRALEIFKNEKNIINDILDKKEVSKIIDERGAF